MRILFIFLFSLNLNCQIELNNLFTDNMVLQRSSSVNVWGESSPNQVIKVYSSWNKKTTKTRADNQGNWIVKINTNSDQNKKNNTKNGNQDNTGKKMLANDEISLEKGNQMVSKINSENQILNLLA